MLKKSFLIILSLMLVVGCKTISVKNKETTAKLLFKNLNKEAEKITDVRVTGIFNITGAKEIPPAFIQFDTYGNLKTNTFTFKILFLKKPLIEIIVEKENVLLVNHTGKEYINLKARDIDFSKFLGVNFNPQDVAYFFLGKIPYSPDMEIMDLEWTKTEYILSITNKVAKYVIHLNSNEEIVRAKIYNEYFDTLTLDAIQYGKDDDKIQIPKTLNFITEDGMIKLTFIIEKISTTQLKQSVFDKTIIKDYKEVFDINQIKVILR